MPRLSLLWTCFWILILSARDVFASSSIENAAACRELKAVVGNVTILPSQSRYASLCIENWSETAWAYPSCIAQPVDIPELQKVVTILVSQQAHFAIRSGGHMPSPLAANINNGVLIDMSLFNGVTYDTTKNVATVGAGQRWRNVYDHLDPYNVTVVGGRVLDVGVGGLTLGSGLSYLSDLYGLVCDNVVNFEVILANASVVNANATSHADLWWALKGGSNNFGIVTAFTLSTYPIHEVWGGIKSYTLRELPALFSAMIEYQLNPNKDPYANLMMQAFTTNASVGAVLNMVYLKPEPSPVAFSPFYSIPTTNDTTKIQTLTQVLSGQIVPAIPRFDWFATSFTPNSSLYQEIVSIVSTAPELQEIESLNAGSLALGLQPISASVVLAGNVRGTNALGLEAVNQTWLVLDTGHWFRDGDEKAHDATRSIHSRIENVTRGNGNYLQYQFMNDASYDQHVIAHYGEASVEKLRMVQTLYDPNLVFQRLVMGGFKLS